MNLDNRCKIVAILGLSFLLVLISANASMAKTLYDNFPNDYISKTLWKDFNTDGNDTNEFVREVNSSTEVLVLKLGTHETYWPVRNALPMVDPDSINAIKADVKIVAMNNDPSDSATVFARIGGIFYNKNSATPSDGVGDIWAELCLGDRGNGL